MTERALPTPWEAPWMTTRAAAEWLGVSQSTAARMLQDGRLGTRGQGAARVSTASVWLALDLDVPVRPGPRRPRVVTWGSGDQGMGSVAPM